MLAQPTFESMYTHTTFQSLIINLPFCFASVVFPVYPSPWQILGQYSGNHTYGIRAKKINNVGKKQKLTQPHPKRFCISSLPWEMNFFVCSRLIETEVWTALSSNRRWPVCRIPECLFNADKD